MTYIDILSFFSFILFDNLSIPRSHELDLPSVSVAVSVLRLQPKSIATDLPTIPVCRQAGVRTTKQGVSPTRSFSFQAEDDVPEYRDRTHPLLPPTPLNQKSAPRYSDDEQRQPLNSLQYTTPIPQQQQQQQQPRLNQYAQDGHARHDSTSSSSSSDSSFTDSSVSRAPRTANVTNHQRESMGNNAPRRPIAAAAAAVGGGNIVGGYRDEDDQWRRGGSSNFMEPDDQYYTSPSPDTYNQYGQGYSVPPVSQINTPLIPGNRFTNPSSPPSAYNQPPPPLHHGKIRGSLPPTPLQGYRPGSVPDRPVLNDPVGGHYTDNPYKRYSTTWDPQLSASQVQIDGTAKDAETFVFSDDEEQAAYNNGGYIAAAAAGTGGAAAAGLGAGKSANTPPRSRGGGGALLGGAGGAGGAAMMSEKAPSSEWMQKQAHQRKKSRWIWGIVILVIILAAAGGTAAGVILRNKNNNSSGASTSSAGSTNGGSGLSADEDVKQNGDLNKDSKEIIALMNNANLKKAFHGMDYTPLNSQYPACIDNPPTQNNITRDVAVMSLLTDKLRLYGTDCNQTEMVLHAIDVLGISMKIWLGVWLDSNTTTNSRQLNHLYTLLANYGADRFEGVAVGNEVLFREDLTETQLFGTIGDVRANLTALSIDLPVGTSDLGSNWKSTMVPYVDVLMANVHPFFAGVTVETAANWTYTFFQENDVILTAGVTPTPRVMISEVGWPSGGGKDRGSVAGIDEMNLFMEDFLCTENKRKTEYFWFSAFDEPWKVVYNEPGKEWEDKWGLMDVNRNLKDGLKIPDCLVT